MRFGKKSNSAIGFPADAMNWIIELLDPVPDILIIESMLPPETMRNKTSRQVRDRLAGLHGVVRAVNCKGVGEIAEASVGDVRAHFISQRSLKRDDAKRGVIDRCQGLGCRTLRTITRPTPAHYGRLPALLIDPQAALSVIALFNKALQVSVWPLTKFPGAGTRSR